MNGWSVAVTVVGPGESGTFDADVAAIDEKLGDLAPAISASAAWVTIRLAVDARDVSAAVERAVGETRAACEAVGWAVDVREVEATEWSLFEAKLEEPLYPELVGITELAELLETSRQRASELARSPRFPAPVADLAAGPVWPKSVVTKFVQEWDRKPGRPRSTRL